MKVNSKLAHPGTLRLWAFGLLMGVLNVHAQPASPGRGIAPSPAAAASTVTPAQPATGPASTATAPRWGDGVLEREFLIKLRTFLENDPFDFKAMDALFGNMEVAPKDGPYPDGSWYFRTVKIRAPLGGEYGNRGPGGAHFAWNHLRTGSYLRLDFVKVAFGDHEKLHQPCLTSDMFTEAFAPPRWTRGYGIQGYSNGLPIYGAPLFTVTSKTGVNVRFSLYVTSCIANLSVHFDRLPPHPARAGVFP